MHVQSILNDKGREVILVSPDETVLGAARILEKRRIGAVLVMDGDHIAGVLSERDLVRGLALQGARILDQSVRSLMTDRVVTCSPSDRIIDIMNVMTNRRLRHVPVIEDGKLAGIISIGDIVKHRIAETETEARALKEYIMS